MTLRELIKINLFPLDTKIYFNRPNGVFEFDNKIMVSNCLSSFIDEVLDLEILMVQPEYNAIMIYFKKDY